MSYNFYVDEQSVKDVLDYLEDVGGNKNRALRMGLNKAGGKVKTRTKDAIRSEVNLAARYITGTNPVSGKQRLYLLRATNRNLSARIATKLRGMLLTRYSTDRTIRTQDTWTKPPPIPARGIKVKVKPGGTAKNVTSSGNPWFYMVGSNSGALLIARRSTETEGKLDVAYGPSIAQVFKNKNIFDPLEQYAQKTFLEEVDRAARYLVTQELDKLQAENPEI